MDINQANGNFIVGNDNYWYKFTSAGTPSAFSALAHNDELGTTGRATGATSPSTTPAAPAGSAKANRAASTRMSEGEGTIKAWKANGEPVSGGFAPPNGVSYGGRVRHRRRLRRRCLGRQLDRWPDPEFNPDGTPTGESFNIGKSVCGMEIDDDGNFYISDYGGGGVWKFSPTGENLGLIDPDSTEARDIAVDNSDGHIYTIHDNHVNEFNATGGFVGEFGRPKAAIPGLCVRRKASPSTKTTTSSTSQTPAGSTPSYGPATSPFPM